MENQMQANPGRKRAERLLAFVVSVRLSLFLGGGLLIAAMYTWVCMFRLDPFIRMEGEPEFDPMWPRGFPYPDRLMLGVENHLIAMGYPRPIAIELILGVLFNTFAGLLIAAAVIGLLNLLRLFPRRAKQADTENDRLTPRTSTSKSVSSSKAWRRD